jgi:hypothetical protein
MASMVSVVNSMVEVKDYLASAKVRPSTTPY